MRKLLGVTMAMIALMVGFSAVAWSNLGITQIGAHSGAKVAVASSSSFAVYRNEWYGFQLEYPNSWRLEEEDWRDSGYPLEVARYHLSLIHI